jgi:hypothetical protein
MLWHKTMDRGGDGLMIVIKYEHLIDGSVYDEEDVRDVASENITMDDLEEVLDHFDFNWLWRHLNEEGRMILYDKAIEFYQEEYFSTIEVEEDE